MSSQEFEKFLASIYSEDELFKIFQSSPRKSFEGFDLNEKEKDSLMNMDMERLALQREILKVKNQNKSKRKSRWFGFLRK